MIYISGGQTTAREPNSVRQPFNVNGVKKQSENFFCLHLQEW